MIKEVVFMHDIVDGTRLPRGSPSPRHVLAYYIMVVKLDDMFCIEFSIEKSDHTSSIGVDCMLHPFYC